MSSTLRQPTEELPTEESPEGDYQPRPYVDDAGVLRAECGTDFHDFARKLVTERIRRGVFNGVQLEFSPRFKRVDTALQRVTEQYERRRLAR